MPIFFAILVGYFTLWGIPTPAHGYVSSRLIRPNRIVGGEIVPEGSFPWQVSLLFHSSFGSSHFCGGTLISDAWMITAGHCTRDINFNKVQAIVGVWDISNIHDERKYKINKVFTNENFNHVSLKNDIALLHLEPIGDASNRDDKAPTPIKVETATEVSKKSCSVSGYGKLASNGILSKKLRAAQVELKDDVTCKKMMTNRSKNYKLYKTNLCAGGEDRDACQGDSGGPLVCCDDMEDPSSCRLTGVVSWGIGCATPHVPGVYTEVAYYKSWIENTISKYEGERSSTILKSIFYTYE